MHKGGQLETCLATRFSKSRLGLVTPKSRHGLVTPGRDIAAM